MSLRYYLFVILVLAAHLVKAQVVTSNPAIPVEGDEVLITFYSDRGNGGLEDFTGDVYAHTGVITDQSSGSSDWKYVKAGWSENIADCKLSRTGQNVYTLSITPDIRTFYGVPEGETIQKMAFVFRSADGSREGKDTGGADIFIEVSDEVLAVSIESPLDKSLVPAGTDVVVSVNALLNDRLTLYVNDTEVETSTQSAIQYTLTNVMEEEYHIRAIASREEETVEQELTFYTRGNTMVESMPQGLSKGVNRLDDHSVAVVLFAPGKEYVYLMGDFNDWRPHSEFMMKKDGDYFWLTLEGLEPDMEYAYQFWMDGDLKIADPYTSKILDPWNDQYIPDRIYPALKAYPQGQTENIVGVFTTRSDDFVWDANDYVAPGKDELVIYEVLIRDFTANQDIKTITDTLSYLKRLGVNAIELMPFNEFEGNDSWGYNPSFYFATDKAYGTSVDYKTFINECHRNGIAVIMDMVLNHSFSQSPLVQMYMEDGKPAADNPWYNREHNMAEPAAQWGFDFNHESPHTQELVDSICSYWMSEYRVDGFRFDFTKGFTNTPYPAGDWASKKDDSRIAILKRMVDAIRHRKPNAYILFEHLSDNDEETILADYGILLWGNMNHNFNEATMGYVSGTNSDLSWSSYLRRGWSQSGLVTYMESHDEERLMYKNKMFGNTTAGYSTKVVTTALKRMEAAAAIFMSIPGPKMIWQFGELGFDLSINRCTNGSISDDCRLAQKPAVWEYQNDADREHLFKVYSRLIAMKTGEEVFNTGDFSMDVGGAMKKVALNLAGSDVRTVANFDVEAQSAVVGFSTTGWWYNVMLGDSTFVSDVNMEMTLQPGEYVVYSQKKLNGFDIQTSIENDASGPDHSIKAYPNPFSSTVNIETGLNGPVQVELYALSGVCVKKSRDNGSVLTLNWGDLPKGHYILKVISGTEVKLLKLIKQ